MFAFKPSLAASACMLHDAADGEDRLRKRPREEEAPLGLDHAESVNLAAYESKVGWISAHVSSGTPLFSLRLLAIEHGPPPPRPDGRSTGSCVSARVPQEELLMGEDDLLMEELTAWGDDPANGDHDAQMLDVAVRHTPRAAYFSWFGRWWCGSTADCASLYGPGRAATRLNVSKIPCSERPVHHLPHHVPLGAVGPQVRSLNEDIMEPAPGLQPGPSGCGGDAAGIPVCCTVSSINVGLA